MILKNTAILILAIFAFQFCNAQTTAEDYKYATQQYKYVELAGVEVKKGYEVVELAELTTEGNSKRTVWVKSLTKMVGGVKKMVGYILVYQLRTGAKEYFCVPHPKSSDALTDLYWKSINGRSIEQLSALLWAVGYACKW